MAQISLARFPKASTQAMLGLRKLKSVIGLIGIVLIAIFISPTAHDGANIFLEPGNLTDILRQMSVIGIIALGMTYVILTAGIDLSVGSILALATSLVAMVVTRPGPGNPLLHAALAVCVAIAASALAGAVNGIAISALRIPAFIVTLASMIGVRGLARWTTKNENIDIGFGSDAAAQFASVFSRKIVIVGIFAVLAVVFWIMLERTVFGRYVRAIGDNEKAGRYTGLPIRRVKIWVYTLTGLLTGIAGIIYAGENHQGNPNAGVAYELDAIAAVVIGGTSLAGGSGSIAGTIVGTLIMGVLTNILRLENVDSNIEMIVKAVIIVLAVAIQKSEKKL
ncbi:MAG TPA: ABC transporter permease [Candidatus Acidoferrales bacterium]|jgi:ribose transport system permease protein|nr:ABC transporter permease [Candidatus Acidoferrales bacterium]